MTKKQLNFALETPKRQKSCFFKTKIVSGKAAFSKSKKNQQQENC
jgi:hypothetical protein